MSLQEMQVLKGFFTEWGKKNLMFLFGIGLGASFTREQIPETSAREMQMFLAGLRGDHLVLHAPSQPGFDNLAGNDSKVAP